jgi:hypothetical protein
VIGRTGVITTVQDKESEQKRVAQVLVAAQMRLRILHHPASEPLKGNQVSQDEAN